VAGLTASDFELRDNEVVQTIASVTRDDIPLDLFLVLDASASVAGELRRALSEAARIALETLAPPDRVSLLTFTHRLTEAARLSSDREAVLKAIDAMGASGATSLFDAVYAALMLREDSPRRALVIVFTDGYDSSSWLPPSAVADVAKQADAVVYGVTLAAAERVRRETVARSGPELLAGQMIVTRSAGRQEPPPFLVEIAAMTGGRVLHASNPAKLRGLFEQAIREMKTRYILSYTPHGVAREGWHALDVRLTRRAGDITARKGYFVP
jgi:Ca-activated chloride channel family protein